MTGAWSADGHQLATRGAAADRGVATDRPRAPRAERRISSRRERSCEARSVTWHREREVERQLIF